MIFNVKPLGIKNDGNINLLYMGALESSLSVYKKDEKACKQNVNQLTKNMPSRDALEFKIS